MAFYSRYNTSGTVDYHLPWSKILLDLLPNIYKPYSLDNGLTILKKRLYKYLLPIFYQIQFISNMFLDYRYENLRTLNVNGQTMVMERYLRDIFTNENIFVVNLQTLADQIYLFNKDNDFIPPGEKVLLYNDYENANLTYLYNMSELNAQYYFTVYIPVALGSRSEEVKFYVNQIRQLGVSWNLIVQDPT